MQPVFQHWLAELELNVPASVQRLMRVSHVTAGPLSQLSTVPADWLAPGGALKWARPSTAQAESSTGTDSRRQSRHSQALSLHDLDAQAEATAVDGAPTVGDTGMLDADLDAQALQMFARTTLGSPSPSAANSSRTVRATGPEGAAVPYESGGEPAWAAAFGEAGSVSAAATVRLIPAMTPPSFSSPVDAAASDSGYHGTGLSPASMSRAVTSQQKALAPPNAWPRSEITAAPPSAPAPSPGASSHSRTHRTRPSVDLLRSLAGAGNIAVAGPADCVTSAHTAAAASALNNSDIHFDATTSSSALDAGITEMEQLRLARAEEDRHIQQLQHRAGALGLPAAAGPPVPNQGLAPLTPEQQLVQYRLRFHLARAAELDEDLKLLAGVEVIS